MKKRRRGGGHKPPVAPLGPWVKPTLLALLLIGVSLPIALFQINNADVWWHVVCGREMLRTWAAPDLSRFYFSPLNPSVGDFRFTFLGDILLAAVDAAGGTVGLQLLVLVCAAALLLFLLRIGRAALNGWTLLLLTLVIFGTGQLFLVRNSLFSLPLLGALFWLLASSQEEGRHRFLFALPVLIGLWGIVHGSYLLGFAVATLIFAGESLDAARRLRGAVFRPVLFSAVLLLSFAAISIGNPMTGRFLRQPFAKVSELFTAEPAATPAAPADGPIDAHAAAAEGHTVVPERTGGGFLNRLKMRLNTLIWVSGADDVQSGDFRSPFDRINYLPVFTALTLAVATLIFASFFVRPVRLAVWLPFFAVLVHGCGYVRSVGYIAIFSAWAILVSARRGDLRMNLAPHFDRWGGRFAIVLVVCFTAALLAASFRGELGRAIGQGDHILGFGKIPAFDDAMCRHILETEGEARVFTTIATGSYALYAWHPHKTVFADGFFAPHPRAVWADYLAARRSGDPDRLFSKYGITLALIENSRSDWNLAFLKAKNWLPCALGLGTTLYRYNDRGPRTFEPPTLLFGSEELAALPDPLFRHRAAAQFYNCVMSLHAKGRAIPALAFRNEHDVLFRRANQWVVPWERGKVDPAGLGIGREYLLTR